MLRRSSREHTEWHCNAMPTNISIDDESVKKRNRKKPTTHSEHRVANELTDNFGDAFVRLEDAKERLFSVTLPDEAEQRETVQVLSEFCPKDVFNCRSRCQYDSCGGCVHMFSCTCWCSTSNGGVLCRHCHAVLPWARTLLKISASNVGDEGIRAEDVMMDGADSEQGSDDMTATTEDGLVPPANDEQRDGKEENVDSDICAQEAISKPSITTIAGDFELPTSSSRRLLTMAATQNAIRTTNDQIPALQNPIVPGLRTSADEATTSNLPANRSTATSSYYISDFELVRQELIQVLQDKRLSDIPDDVKRELCGNFSELVAVMRNYIWQIRKKRTFVRILKYPHNANAATAPHSSTICATSTIHPPDRNGASTSENLPCYASSYIGPLVSFGRMPRMRFHRSGNEFIRTSETTVNSLTDPPAIVIAHEAELADPQLPTMIHETAELLKNPQPPRMTREAEIVRRLRGSNNGNVTSVESRIVTRLKDDGRSSMNSSISSVPIVMNLSEQQQTLVVPEPKEFRCSEIKEECERIEATGPETETIRASQRELSEENSSSAVREPDAVVSQISRPAECDERGQAEECTERGTRNVAQDSEMTFDSKGYVGGIDSEGEHSKVSAFVKLESTDNNVVTAEASMVLPPSTSQDGSLFAVNAQQRLGQLISEQVVNCIELLSGSPHDGKEVCAAKRPRNDLHSSLPVTCALGKPGCTGEAYQATVRDKRRNKVYERIRCSGCKRFRCAAHVLMTTRIAPPRARKALRYRRQSDGEDVKLLRATQSVGGIRCIF